MRGDYQHGVDFSSDGGMEVRELFEALSLEPIGLFQNSLLFFEEPDLVRVCLAQVPL